MKNLLLLAFLLLNTVVFSQSIIQPDTVCINTPGSTYQVANIPGVTFTWTVLAPGVIVSGQNTNSIQVNWSAAPAGLITNGVTVTATGSTCPIIPVDIDVFIYQPVSNITLVGPFCQGDPCVTLTATPLGGTFSGTGVSGSTFCPTLSGQGTFPITYSGTDRGCPITSTINVIVNSSITIGPIQHN